MKIYIFFILLLFAQGLSAEDVSNSINNNQIAFLTFHTDGDNVMLVKSKVVSGSLKIGHDLLKTTGIFYEIISKSLSVDSGYIDNPLIKKFEYEDPQNPGQMAVKFVEFDEIDFMIRIKYNAEIEQIRFFIQSDANKSSRKLLSTISIPQLKEEQK